MARLAEQIAAFEAKRAALVAANAAIMDEAAEEGATLDAEHKEEFDGNQADIGEIDDHLDRLRKAEKASSEKAQPIDPKTANPAAPVQSRIELRKRPLEKGTGFARYAMALMASKGNLMQAEQIALNNDWGDTPEVAAVLKAAVAAGTTTNATWAKPLVEYQNLASEFAELLRPATIIGRIPGLRRVPFNIKIPRQTAGSSAAWVGEGAPKPVSALAFDQIQLGATKLAGIVVLTEELVRFSDPSAEAVVRQDLINTIVQTMDSDFVNPTNAGIVNVKPASITNGVTAIIASGTTSDAARADIKALLTAFITANLSLDGAVWIMPEVLALSLQFMLTPLDQPVFPGLPGTLMGLPVITSNSVPAGTIILAKANEILLADDGQTMLDASNQASLQMDSAPLNPPDATVVMTSLWQMNLVGIRAERFINWAKRRATAVALITGAAYVS